VVTGVGCGDIKKLAGENPPKIAANPASSLIAKGSASWFCFALFKFLCVTSFRAGLRAVVDKKHATR
jgi:hypothetical protein